MKFLDGLKSFLSSLINSRLATSENYIEGVRLTQTDMRNIYRTGLGSKIIRIKAGDALKDTLQFESETDGEFYKQRLAQPVKKAARWCLAFGRGIIVIHHRGDDLATPLGAVDKARALLSVFSGDLVVPTVIDMNLQSERYLKPVRYSVRGAVIHYTRVVDFTYVEPSYFDAPRYFYGGISEFELVYEQLIADGVVQRSSPRILDKASTLFYKVKGFREAMATGTEADMLSYFSTLESVRGTMSAGVIDADDELEVVTQSINNLADADQITLRRLAMVTGISVTRLIGEAPRGMNSSGDKEAQMDQDMLETLQDDYFFAPINQLMSKLGMGRCWFKDNQGETPQGRLDYETAAIDNAVKLQALGEDYRGYLNEKDILARDEFGELFDDGGEDDGEA